MTRIKHINVRSAVMTGMFFIMTLQLLLIGLVLAFLVVTGQVRLGQIVQQLPIMLLTILQGGVMFGVVCGAAAFAYNCAAGLTGGLSVQLAPDDDFADNDDEKPKNDWKKQQIDISGDDDDTTPMI